MEGISQEALTLAGHLKLAKLIVLFDDNGISIDGPVTLANSTDQPARFAASGWAVARVDGHDPGAVAAAIAKAPAQRPADLDRLPDHHRLRRAAQAGHRGGPWLAARGGRARGGARAAGLGASALRDPGGAPCGLAGGRPARRRGKAGLGSSASPGSTRRSGQNSIAGCGATCRRRSPPAMRTYIERLVAEAAGARDAQRLAECARCHQCHGARDHRRVGRSHRLQQHPSKDMKPLTADRLWRALHPLGHPRACHGRRDERA